MKHLVENFVKQFEVCDPRKIMTKETYKYVSSLHRRHIFSDGKYGVLSKFIEDLDRPSKKWQTFKTKVLFKKKSYIKNIFIPQLNEQLKNR